MAAAAGEVGQQYDVAISFLAADEPFANELAGHLAPALRVFVYSKAQEHLVGRDGAEEFRDVFRRNNRLTVVLHREGWGETRFTRVEETAIRDRAVSDGWRHLLVVRMDQAPLRPWIPDTQLYFDPAVFPLGDLVAAIRARCAELGVNIRPPTVAEIARAQHEDELFAAETLRLLSDSNQHFREQSELLGTAMHDRVREIMDATGRELISGAAQYGGYIVFDEPYTLHLRPQELYANTARDAYLEANHVEGRLLLQSEAGRMFVFGEPRVLSRTRLDIRRVRGPSWVWELEGRVLPTAAVADELMRRFLDLRGRRRR